MESKCLGMFNFLITTLMQPSKKLFQETAVHLRLLRTELTLYFPDIIWCKYTVNPISIDPALLPIGTGEQEEIIDLQTDERAKNKHKECSPINFWLNIVNG